MSTDRPIHNAADLGTFIAERRKRRGLTQQDLADFAGVGRRFLSEIENGKPTAEIGKILRVLIALGSDLVLRDR
ncbi:MAG TPA: helix-turn-helix transcriptional regulator [Devosia sp.]|nr:helix-turn-helix transcriptional regulator [Devosia sp.]